MVVARVALALSLVMSVRQTSMAEPCAPRAELDGDADAVSQVAIELQRLGVDASTDPLKRIATSCPVIVAAVELDHSGGIAVAVRDSSHRSEGRVVSDAALAAAWIDSWLRDDFVAPAIEAPAIEPVRAPATVEPAAAAVTERPVFERFMATVSYVETWSERRSWSSGFAVSGCVHASGFCIGGRAGYVHEDIATDVSAASKADVSLLATISYSRRFDRVSLAPELGVGVSRLTTSRIEACEAIMPPTCDPMTDPTCMPMESEPTLCPSPAPMMAQTYVGDRFSETSYSPRVSAALRIAVPLFEHVSLDGIAAATITPFAHTADYASKDPDAAPMTPNTMNTDGSFPLPGDARFGLQLGVGLRVGIP